MIKKRDFILVLILFFLLNFYALAHVEHAGPNLESDSIWYKIFLVHDWLHPIFFILMIYSCYYFRIFSSRNIYHEPKVCLGDCSKCAKQGCYKEENWLKRNHRYFFWITLILTFIHVGEIIPSIWILPVASSLDLWVFISEGSYLIFALLFLFTCYHFRYFVERLAKRKIVSYGVYNFLTSLNRLHNAFFWITITLVLVRFALVVISTNSIIQAIPGTF